MNESSKSLMPAFVMGFIALFGLILYLNVRQDVKARSEGANPTGRNASSASANSEARVKTIDYSGRTLQQEQYLAAFRRRIDFYGCVVDEGDHPVAGAKVILALLDNPYLSDAPGDVRAKNSTLSTKSDSLGKFTVKRMRGAHLLVSVSKEGYYSMPGKSNASFSLDSENPSENVYFLPKSNDFPAKFILKKIGNPTALFYVDDKVVLLGKVGRVVGVSLQTGAVVDLDKADFCAQLSVDEPVSGPFSQYSWRCRITVPGGGIQLRRDDFDLTAPLDGYQSLDEVVYLSSMPREKWSTDDFHNYFIKTGAGNYARMKVRISTGIRNGIIIEESLLNPQGETNLEYDKAKSKELVEHRQ